MLQFKDSERDEVIDYLKKRSKSIKRVDTPTRLLNYSNDFLPIDDVEMPIMHNQKEEIITPRLEL